MIMRRSWVGAMMALTVFAWAEARPWWQDPAAPVPAPAQEAAVAQEAAAAVEEAGGVVAPDATEPTTHPLEELGWLVGDWQDQDSEAQVETRYQWTKNGAFLLHSFRVALPEGEPMSGMQIIGWDAARETVRSWTYDSDGGFGEATWSHDGDRWTIKADFTTAEGEKASAINIMKPVSEDAYTWKSVNREVGGQILPDIEETLVVRVTDASAEAAGPEAEEGGVDTTAPADAAVTPTSGLAVPSKSLPIISDQ